MSERWWGYFQENMKGKHWLSEAVSQYQFMQPLYGTIDHYLSPGGRILDVGCGLGFNDIYLASKGYQVTGIDNEHRVIESSLASAKKMETNVDFKVGDAFDLSDEYGKHDLVYSLGVLEHFDRHVTVQLLKEQMKCGKYVLIEIPTRYTAYASGITDERIYSMRELRSIVTEAGLSIESSFGFGDVMAKDYHIWLKRALPYAAYRVIQNNGFAYCMAVIGYSDAYLQYSKKFRNLET